MFGSFFASPFNPNSISGGSGMAGFPGQPQAGQQQQGGAASPFGASSPVFPGGLSGLGGGSGMAGLSQSIQQQAQNDPLAQLGLQSMSPDTQMLFMSLQTMMVGLMAMIAATLAGILNGSISGQAPPGSTGAGSGNTPGTNGATGPGGRSNVGSGPVGTVNEASPGDFGGTQLNAEQTRNAAIIAEVGKEMGMSKRDIQVAIATAMQESTLKNLDYGDRDSVGLFQQRTSQGWGSVEQIMDPRYSARKFFEGLQKQDNRDSRAITDLAQSVQRSAFPDAYAKWEGMAGALVNAMLG